MGLDQYLYANATGDAPNFPVGVTADWDKDTNPAARELADVLGLPKDNAGVGNYGYVEVTNGDEANPDRRTVTVHAGYWRKANAVHLWFVRKVQGGEDECNPHDVTIDQLRELKGECLEALSVASTVEAELPISSFAGGKLVDSTITGTIVTNPEVLQEILPTTSGFFFGSTDYDHWYLEDLKHTVAVVDACIAAHDANNTITFRYCSSW